MKLITIIGPTAVGKTKLAVALAYELGGEVISADSRQVYRKMDIGTGKDLKDFEIGNLKIPHHLIDIKEAGEEYNLFQFQRDFYAALENIIKRNKVPILCGGTGMYLQAALAKEQLLEVPINHLKRKQLESLNLEELNSLLYSIHKNLHNTTDLKDRARTIRAIEIEEFKKNNKDEIKISPIKNHLVIGIKMEREALRKRIKERLVDRLKEGMIDEVKQLISSGLTHTQLDYYGLEYRYISQYLNGKISYEEMYDNLLQSIRRFAKKQMTWYRRMEKMGTKIHWLDSNLSLEEKLIAIKKII